MTELQDFGIENPIKKKEQERFTIKTRTAYCLYDNLHDWYVDLAVDFTESGKGREDMEKERTKREELEGKTFVVKKEENKNE